MGVTGEGVRLGLPWVVCRREPSGHSGPKWQCQAPCGGGARGWVGLYHPPLPSAFHFITRIKTALTSFPPPLLSLGGEGGEAWRTGDKGGGQVEKWSLAVFRGEILAQPLALCDPVFGVCSVPAPRWVYCLPCGEPRLPRESLYYQCRAHNWPSFNSGWVNEKDSCLVFITGMFNILRWWCTGWCDSVDWALVKGRWFSSQSGHMPGLRARSLVGGTRGGVWKQPHINVSLRLSLPPFPSLKISK